MTTRRKIARLVLPWPKLSELSANGRLHWRAKHRKTKAQKNMAAWLAIEAGLQRVKIEDGAQIFVTYTACPPSRVSRFDDDNLGTALKGARDAIAEVLGVDDSRFQVQPIERGERSKDGGVIVEIEVSA